MGQHRIQKLYVAPQEHGADCMASRERYWSVGHTICSIRYTCMGRVSSGRTGKLKRRKVAVFENAVRSALHQELNLPCGNSDEWRGKETWRCHTEYWLNLRGWGFPWTRTPLTSQRQPESSNGRELPTQAAFWRGAQQDIALWMAIIKMLSDTVGGDRITRKDCSIWC